METTTKCGRYAYRVAHHFQKYAKKCIELGIPAPFAAEMTRNASESLKVTILCYVLGAKSFFLSLR